MLLQRFRRFITGLPLNLLLFVGSFRRRVAFKLKQDYYDELEIVVPLGNGVVCPVTNSDHWHSFCEIFLQHEYKSALSSIPLPKRWLDLGCHAGYFSLYVAWLRAQQKAPGPLEALLVDGDPRVVSGVTKLIKLNGMCQTAFLPGIVGAGEGERQFALGSAMSSAAMKNDGASACDNIVSVGVITQEEMMQALPPPYDLIKIDVEGGEYEFLNAYSKLIAASRYLLLEWHSWGTEGGGIDKIQQLAKNLQLTCLTEPVPAHEVIVGGKVQQCGVLLFGSLQACAAVDSRQETSK